MSEPPHAPEAMPHRLLIRGGLTFLPLLLILGLLAYQTWSGHQAARHEARITVANLADMLTLSIESALDRMGGDLDAFAATLALDDLHSGLDDHQRAALERLMEQSLANFDAVLNYRLFDANGQSLAAAGRASAHLPVNVADRPWFLKLQNRPDLPYVLSEVLNNRVSGQAGIVFARPLRDGSGHFVGVVNAFIDLGWFQGIIDALDIGQHGLVTLRHRDDARLLLRRPLIAEQVNESHTGLYKLHISGVHHAEGEFVSAIDQVVRLYAFRGLNHYPLSVVVAIAAKDYLSTWYVQAGLTGTVALLLGLIQFILLRRLDRAYHRSMRLADDLHRSNLNLQRSNAELEEFAYIASHDLQSPLRNIASFSQLLERRFKPELGPEGAEFINFIVTNATRMAGLIQDLLAYARISRPEHAPQDTDSEAVLRQVLDDMAPAIAKAGARITVGVLPRVPVSPHQLSSLLMNLVENAVKYRDPDRLIEISICAEKTDADLWQFEIRDTGIGIDPEHWEKIFAIFQRLHGVESYEGTGIGLALCRRIVHHWGGTIWVRSKPGLGSIFYFTVPSR